MMTLHYVSHLRQVLLYVFVFVVSFGIFPNILLGKPQTYEIKQPSNILDLTPYFSILAETGTPLTYEVVRQMEGQFQAFDPQIKLEKNTVYWGKLKLHNRTGHPGKWILSPDWNTNVQRNSYATCYFSATDSVMTGRFHPYSQKDSIGKVFPNNQFLVSLDAGESKTIYLKISQYDYRRPVFQPRLLDYAHWKGENQQLKLIIQAVFQGIVWTMIFFALLMFWSQKDISYFYFALFLFSTSIYFLYVSGIMYETLLREIPKWSNYVWVTATHLLAIGYFQFARNFLNTPQLIPYWDKLSLWFIRGLVILGVLELLFLAIIHNQPLINNLNNLIILSEVTFLLIVSMTYFNEAYGVARVFSWGTLCIVLAGFIGLTFQIMGEFQKYLPIVQFCFVLKILTFSWGLGYRHYIGKKKGMLEKEINTFKSQFFANITHEFRTPLSVIMQESGYLHKHQRTLPADRITKMLGVIRANGALVLRLVNQILDLSKLEAKKMPIQWKHADIIPFLHQLLEPFVSHAEKKQLSLHIDIRETSLMMDFDPNGVQTILSNLLFNAIKFTPEGGSVEFVCRKEAGKEQHILIWEVKDSGKGISQEDLPNIFKRYFQSESNEVQTPGTGIGLALVDQQVKALNGTIEVKSEIGKGTQFVVRLPIHTHHTQAPSEIAPNGEEMEGIDAALTNQELASPPTQQQPDYSQDSILLIEDNPDILRYLKTVLSPYYRVSVARNGAEGIDLALQLIPDLILSDVMMPEKDGYEVVQTLKTDTRTSHIPIVLLTARADQEARIMGLEYGAVDYLVKPIDEDTLILTINNLLAFRNEVRKKYASGEFETSENISPDEAFLLEVKKLIDANLASPELDPEFLHTSLNLSYHQLHRKIRALTGASTKKYINHIRLERGAQLLKTTDLNISEIAYQVGFSDPAYFSRLFSQKYGMSPKAYRDSF